MAYKVEMTREQLPRSGMALGGIGAGWFEIRQDGGFHNWTIFNNHPLFTGPLYPHNPKTTLFFMLRVKVGEGDPRLVLLQIEDSHESAGIEGHEFQYMFPWISGVDTIRYKASFPFAELEFGQEGLPLKVSLRAWSPFIPGNVKDSALPLAWFDFDIESTSDEPVDVQLLGIFRNTAGYDQPERAYRNRRISGEGFSGVMTDNTGMDPDASTTGTLALVALDPEARAYMGWEHHHPYYERLLTEDLLPEVDDTEGRNKSNKETGAVTAMPRCFSTVGSHGVLTGMGDSIRRSFAFCWHFPNLYAAPEKIEHDVPPPAGAVGKLEGHYYNRFFKSATDVAAYACRERDRLESESRGFHGAFFDSSLPPAVLDQVNSHLNTFFTSSWLTDTNMYGILEGLSPEKPWAGICTTDVAMYGHIATSLLFPELDRMVINLWCKFQNDNGSVIHSIHRNSTFMPEWERNAKRLDMPGQFVFMALRCALWGDDELYLKKIWPHAKAALAYVLRERDHNGDGLPDMEGIMCSYDNFAMYGVAPFVAVQWLAAVELAIVVARHLGDEAFVSKYKQVFQMGVRSLIDSCWENDYLKLYSDSAKGSVKEAGGCMTDQLLGLWAAGDMGLDLGLSQDTVHTAISTIMRMNFKPDQGLRNCQWPGDTFLHPVDKDTWIDQANTCWTGVELAFGGLLYRMGRVGEAEKVITNVDKRYRKFGMYFDHQEFGGHYFRPMSALSIPNAYLGASYREGILVINPAHQLPDGRWAILLPGGCLTLARTGSRYTLTVSHGTVAINGFIIMSDGQQVASVDYASVQHMKTGTQIL